MCARVQLQQAKCHSSVRIDKVFPCVSGPTPELRLSELLLAICRPSGCTVASGVVVVGGGGGSAPVTTLR